MPLKQDRTSFNVSSNLKTVMAAKGYSTNVQEGRTYYDSAATEIHLALFQLSDGKFRNVANTSTFTDIVDPADPNFVQMWIEEELAIFIGRVPGVQGTVTTLNGNTWTCAITFNGVDQTGQDTKKVDAMAKALIKVLNLL